MENKLQEEIIKTITYFDIFDYPPTLSEIKKYLGEKFVTTEEIEESLAVMSLVQEYQGFYYLLGRKKIVEKRMERSEVSIYKNAKARLAAKIFSKIPTIKLIGISGSLSMNNSAAGDDIDLFIITSKNSLWMTRFLVRASLFFMGQKRLSRVEQFKDQFCINMYMSEEDLSFKKKQQNLFTAHEIAQLKVIYQKEQMYERLVKKNSWVNQYLPHAFTKVRIKNRKDTLLSLMVYKLNSIIDPIFYTMQNTYLAMHKKSKVVSKSRAMFHSVNKGQLILDLFQLKLEQNLKNLYDNQWIDRDDARFYFDDQKMRILN